MGRETGYSAFIMFLYESTWFHLFSDSLAYMVPLNLLEAPRRSTEPHPEVIRPWEGHVARVRLSKVPKVTEKKIMQQHT